MYKTGQESSHKKEYHYFGLVTKVIAFFCNIFQEYFETFYICNFLLVIGRSLK